MSMSMSMAKPKKNVVLPTAVTGFEAKAVSDTPVRETLEEVVEGKVGKEEETLVIPALQNTFGGRQLAQPMIDEAQPQAAVAKEPAAPVAKPVPQLTEDEEAAAALMEEASGIQLNDDERYRSDVATRADQAGHDAYERMPIESFGKAMLRGMGWQEGVGLNGKGLVEPVEYVPRPQLLGLAATPQNEDPKASKKKYIKPGETREKKDMIYVDEQGRQRHIKRVGDKLVERGATGFSAGALVAITTGVHKDLYGRVVSTGGIEGNIKALLRLTTSGEQVQVALTDLKPVRDVQLERERHGFTHKQAAAAEGKVEKDGPKAAREARTALKRQGREVEHQTSVVATVVPNAAQAVVPVSVEVRKPAAIKAWVE